MTIQRLHHVAYRCTDARETVEFYENYLDLELATSIAATAAGAEGRPPFHTSSYTGAVQPNGQLI